MKNFSVDYIDLQKKLSEKKAFRLSDVKGKIKKVAFDVVRFVDSDKLDDLWQIHTDGDDEYIVAMYEEEQTEKTASASTPAPWKALPDGSGNNIHLFYKDTPIKKIALAPLGIPATDAWMVSHSLSQRLATDQSFFDSFLNELTEKERQVLTEAAPSLLAGK